ncbi:RsmD family RNA methyltransferase [Candidatus Peregrinibacteria bacterium]|nr:RsmD family RNA methyltransferase [Candidatus Peregrinibacteria bacterium]
MPSYAAILGHQPQISIAELAAFVPGFSLKKKIGKSIAVFESSADLTLEDFMKVGGTIVVAKKITDGAVTLEDVPQMLVKECATIKGKITFGLRAYGIPRKKIRELYRLAKDALKKSGRPSRYVGTERSPAAAVLLHDAGMLDASHGCEIFLASDADAAMESELPEDAEAWIGRTIFAQDVDAYSKRDMQKPARDTTVGLLPPKLAQILLNFGVFVSKRNAGTKDQPFAIYDPFCGTGVIPMEALLRGWRVFASDTSQKAVNACTNNLEWLRKEEKILKRDVASEVWKHDASKPFVPPGGTQGKPFKELPDVIVTETTLGPALTERPPIKDAQKWKTENERIQIAFLENVAKTLPGVAVVCTWPVWYHSKGQIHLEKAWDKLHDLGFRATLPPGIASDVEGRLSLIYRRPDQFVGREIVMLQAKK